MRFAHRLSPAWSELTQTASRFGPSLFAAIAWTAITLRDATSNGAPLPINTELRAFQILLFFSFFLFLAIRLWGENHGLHDYTRFLVALLAFVLIAASAFRDSIPILAREMPDPLILGFAVVSLPVFLPFLGARKSSLDFWDFNRKAWLGALFGLLVALILGAGVSLALVTLDALLEFPISGHALTYVWIICLGLVWPWHALALVPKEMSTPAKTAFPKWMGYLGAYVAVPLVIVYFAILYAYIGKMVVEWSLPSGEIGWLVAGYASLGIAVHLFVYGQREEGPAWVRIFSRHFYYSLVFPVVLLAIAATIRIEAYGVTEERYVLVLLTVWLGLNALAATLRPQRHLALVPASLAVLLTLGSAGPWGASSISFNSQVAQLEQILRDTGRLVDGRLNLANTLQSPEASKRVSSILRYFSERGRLEDLRARLARIGLTVASQPANEDFEVALGFKYLSEDDPLRWTSFRAHREPAIQVSGYDFLWNLDLRWTGEWHALSARTDEEFTLSYDRTSAQLTVLRADGAEVNLDLSKAVSDATKTSSGLRKDRDQLPIILDQTNPSFRVRIVIWEFHGKPTGSDLGPSHVSISVLIADTT